MLMSKCHICRKIEELTNEHVPPRSAFNSQRSILYGSKEVLNVITSDSFPWDFSSQKGTQKQSGIGFKKLCATCNNNTGSWYGPGFVDFIIQGIKAVISNQTKNRINIKFKDIYPLKIMKQIVCMFLAINRPELAERNIGLREFALDKQKKGLPDKYKFYIYGFKGKLIKYVGLGSIIKNTKILSRDNIRFVSEIAAMSSGYVMEIDPKKEDLLVDITHFSDYKFSQKIDLDIELPLLECNSVYPLDYRSQKEIKNGSKVL